MVIASFNSPVLFTIANNLKKMQVPADVDEADIGQVKVGQQAKFTVDTYPNDVFTGVVTQIRRQPVIVQNVVNYVVIIEVPNPGSKLMPGLTANSNIFVQERKNVLKVPTNALTFTPPAEYIQSTNILPDSVKESWIKKLHVGSELQKKRIAEIDQTEGYLWVKNGQDISPVPVRKGLNDGTFTEVSGKLRQGDEAVTGINHSLPSEDAKLT
jgi:HlyD family secretion protein